MAASAPRSSRRPLLPRGARCLAVAALLLAGVLACGSQGGGEETGLASNASESTVFPVTITHAFGTSVVPAEPKRVVAIGFNESDFLLALGVRPVGVRDFIGEFPEDTRVWAKKQAGNSRPEKVGGQEVNIEKVAALRPDLIMGIYSSIDKPTYDKLARIAPTIGPESTTTSTTWQDQTLITGKALGREGQAKKVVADVETRIAALTKEHPEFKGKRLAIAFGPDISTGTYVLPPSDLRTQMFTDLGFVMPDQTEQISREQFGLLDQDLVAVIGTEQKVFSRDPLVRNLEVAKEGRIVYFGDFGSEFSGALGYGSPLSLPYALDLAVPRLAAALDGDPATSANQDTT